MKHSIKIKASLITKNNAIQTETWIGDGHFMVKTEKLSPANVAQIMARGEREGLKDEAVNNILPANPKEFVQLDLVLTGYDNGKEVDILCFYCELTDEVACINRVYSALVSPIMKSDGGPLTNKDRSVIIAQMGDTTFTDHAKGLKIAADLASKLLSKY